MLSSGYLILGSNCNVGVRTLSCVESGLCLNSGSVDTIMDNITDNETIVRGFLSQPAYLAYSSILLFAIMLPAAILNSINLVSLVLQSSLLSTVRLALGALAVAGLLNALGLIMQRLSGIILVSTLLPNPSLGACQFILWTILTGAACRLTFLALFAIFVLALIVAKPKYTRPVVFAVIFAIAFLVICAVCAVAFSPTVTNVHYASGASCGPLSAGNPTIAFVIFYLLVFAIVPLCVSLVVPIVALCYIHKNTITDDATLKKAMARFALFLLIGNVFNFIGIALPAAIAAQRTTSSISTNGGVVEYLPYAMMSLSLLPLPILMLIFFKAVRDGIVKIFCCCCKEKVDVKGSRATTVSKARTKEAELSV